MATLRAAELEVLFTADTNQVTQAASDVQTIGRRVEANPITQTIEGDETGALASMDRVTEAAKKLVSQDTALKLDADVTRAEKNLDRAKQKLADLEVRALGGLDVTADVRRAEANLQRVERNLQGLQNARTMIEVDASTVRADAALEELQDTAADAGDSAGEEGGKRLGAGLGKNLMTALAAIPIAGGIVLAGVAIGKSLLDGISDGLNQEVGRDRLQALTGIDEGDATRLGRAAGEAYANVFGESVEANMDTTRLALQFDLIDSDTSTKSAQKVIEGLAGIADVLGEDIQPIAATVTKMLNAGLVPSAQAAFDIIATGAREGVNLGEDLLDTLGQYASTFSALGLSGDQALGLLNQGLEAGAPNADFFADSVRELGIRVREGDEATGDFLKQAGLVPDVLAKAFVEGGSVAAAGLGSVYDALNAIEDPVERNRVAVGILGTQFEDLQLDLSALDLTTAVDGLNGVEGAAQKMFDTLGSNDATKLEQAKRNIEVAADGMKGALAAAFSEPLSDAADWISRNRGPMLQFFLDLANGAIDFSEGFVDGIADGTEAVGGFIAGPLAALVEGLAGVIDVLNGQEGRPVELDELAESMRTFDTVADDAADSVRGLKDGLEDSRDRLNEFGEGAVAMGYLNDATLRLADSIGLVGLNTEGAVIALSDVDLANIRTSQSGRELEDSVRAGVAALADQVAAAATAGEGQDVLAERYRSGTDALAGQLTQMGLTEEEARNLINTVLETPTSATTEFGSNATEQQGRVQGLADRITTLPDGSIVINADPAPADTEVDDLIRRNNGKQIQLKVTAAAAGSAWANLGAAVPFRNGGVVEFMAQGGLTPMSPVAQVVPASTWRVVGDRSDVSEAYIPLDRSPRSMAILFETMQRMGVQAMGEGGITAASERGPVTVHISVVTEPAEDPTLLARRIGREIKDALGG
jgi:phage-related minor tail protein